MDDLVIEYLEVYEIVVKVRRYFYFLMDLEELMVEKKDNKW